MTSRIAACRSFDRRIVRRASTPVRGVTWTMPAARAILLSVRFFQFVRAWLKTRISKKATRTSVEIRKSRSFWTTDQ